MEVIKCVWADCEYMFYIIKYVLADCEYMLYVIKYVSADCNGSSMDISLNQM